MSKKSLLSALAGVALLGATPAFAAGEGAELVDYDFPFEGPFGSYDEAQLQRGFQVFHQICRNCHGLEQVYFRNLAEEGGPNFPEDMVRVWAEEYFVPDDGPEAFPGDERSARITDQFPAGSLSNAPDLSLMAKARAGFHGPYGTGINQLLRGIGGPEYIANLLAGYVDTPECALESDIDGYYNAYFTAGGYPEECLDENGYHTVPGTWISMAPPLYGDDVEYEDGSPTDVVSVSQDVSAFLMWAAEPKMTNRKQIGLAGVLLLGLMAVLLYFTNKKLWHNVKHRSEDT